MFPAISRLYEYTRTFGKKDVQTYTNTPHSWTDQKLGQTFWEVINSSPDRLQAFARGLSLFDAIHPNIGIYPFEAQHSAGNSPTRPFVVDIGGGRGLALLDLRRAFPSLQGQLILQDRKEVLDAIAEEDLPDVQKMQHDFFTPQPIHGAQIYYIRRVFHDWLDDEARSILRNIVPAMAPDSRILISDMALPEPVTAKDANAVWLDLMMLTIGGKERTKRDWELLVESAGLRLVKLWQKEELKPLVVVECALPDGGADTEEGNQVENGIQTEPEKNGIEPEEKLTEPQTTATDTPTVDGLANGVEQPQMNGHQPNHETREA